MRAAEPAFGSQPGIRNGSLLWGTVLCTLLGYFAVQSLMPAARAGQGVFSFGQLHLVSTVFYGLKVVLVLVLAWRATATRQPQSTAFFLTLVTRGLARLISPPAVTRWLPKSLTFLICGRWLPLFENFRIFTTRGPGMPAAGATF